MPNARINPGNKKGAALGAMMKLQTYSISGVKAMLLLKVVADGAKFFSARKMVPIAISMKDWKKWSVH